MNKAHRMVHASGTAALIAACGGTPRVSPEVIEPVKECDVAQLGGAVSERSPTPRELPETLVVAITDSIDLRRAPRPRNDGERFLFRQLYETLVRVDCTGRVYSRVSLEWSGGAGEREWTVTLWDGAAFWDGSPVTTGDVVASWQSRSVALKTVASITSVTVLDDRILSLTYPRMARGPPEMLAAPVLAISKRSESGEWPVGSGGFRIARIERQGPDGLSETLTLVPVRPPPGGQSHVVRVRIAPGSDPRDLMDAQADLLFTRDPSALAYAATRSEYLSVPLPWDRAYVLMVSAAADGSFTPGGVSGSLREALARDATGSEARAAAEPFWWRELATSCDVLLAEDSPSVDPSRRTARVVYLAEDLEARPLAERLVALASGERPQLRIVSPTRSQGTIPTAAGLSPSEFAAALRSGTELAYVLRLRRLVFDPCTELGTLIAQAPWLGSRTGLLDAIVPLVDTRQRAVMRRTLSGLTVDLDGTVVLPLP